MIKRSVVVLLLIFMVVGCTPKTQHYSKSATVGGLGGGLTGAATGALVGTVIANGDVAASALLGGAVGVPLGIAAAVYYQQQQEAKEFKENELVINSNKDFILTQNEQIKKLKQSVSDDITSKVANFNFVTESNSESVYTGPTIGLYR